MIRINKLRLDDELEIQAEMQERISSEVARLNTRALEAENELKVTEARLMEDLKESDVRVSVDALKAAIKRHPDRTKAWTRWQVAREVHEEWDGLLQAWITKGYKLADLGALFGSDYFAIKTITREDGARRKDVDPIDEASRSALRRATERVNASQDGEVAPRRRTSL